MHSSKHDYTWALVVIKTLEMKYFKDWSALVKQDLENQDDLLIKYVII